MCLSPTLPDNGLVAHWDMWYGCSQHCPYCFYQGSQEQMRQREAAVSPVEWAAAFRRLNRPLFITIDGGEPFAKPDFLEILSLIQEFAFIGIATSMSIDLKEFLTIADFSRISRMLLSYHPTECKAPGVFIERVHQLLSAGLRTYVVNCVAYPAYLDELAQFVTTFRDAGLEMHVTRFVGEYGGVRYPSGYTESELTMLATMMTNPINVKQMTGQNRANGARCGAGRGFIFVGANGDVSRCCHHMHEVLGNLLAGDFVPGAEDAPCHASACFAFQAIERGITPFLSLQQARTHTRQFYTHV